MLYGILGVHMDAAKKITVQLPTGLLRRAQRATGLGLTPTIRKGLELVAAGEAYAKLAKLRGKVKFTIHLPSLREDRT